MKRNCITLLKLEWSLNSSLHSHVMDLPRNMFNIKWHKRYISILLYWKHLVASPFNIDLFEYQSFYNYLHLNFYFWNTGFRVVEYDIWRRICVCMRWCQGHGAWCPSNSPHHRARTGLISKAENVATFFPLSLWGPLICWWNSHHNILLWLSYWHKHKLLEPSIFPILVSGAMLTGHYYEKDGLFWLFMKFRTCFTPFTWREHSF